MPCGLFLWSPSLFPLGCLAAQAPGSIFPALVSPYHPATFGVKFPLHFLSLEPLRLSALKQSLRERDTVLGLRSTDMRVVMKSGLHVNHSFRQESK